jgi:hypothetical protein
MSGFQFGVTCFSGFLQWVFMTPLRAFRSWRQAIKDSKDQDVDPW